RSRRKVAWIAGCIVFIAGIPSALSSSTMENFKIFNLTVFDASDFLVSNIMLPAGCLFISLFIGYKMERTLVKEEFLLSSYLSVGTFKAWYTLIKTIVPVTIIVVFLTSIGIIYLN